MSYIGIPPFGQTIRSVTNHTATSGQTTFTITGGYVIGYVDVYLNGVLLTPDDYTATNNTTVVLATGATTGDEFQAISYQPVSLSDPQPRGNDSNKVFFENDKLVTSDYTVTSGKNAMSAGPITVDSGVTVTVPSGSTWTVI